MVIIKMRIITRRKGNKDYYYLQHSYRENNKIITKEIYLGKNIPKNLAEIKEKLEKEIRKEVYFKLEKIKENFQKEWKKLPETVKDKEKENIAIAFTYNTNAIEGSTITLQETKLILQDKMAPNKPLNEIKETENHAKVFFEMLSKKENVNIALLLKLHKDIFNETKKDIVGKFRDYLVRVGDYIAVDWQDVNKLMQELITFINKSNLNAVELAAISHYRFEKIHPFGDGNGRIGRLLMNYILWKNNYPMLVIENKKKFSYYRALQKGEEAFLKYFLRIYLKVHKKYINYV